MNGKAAQFAVFAGGQAKRTPGDPPGPEFQECWFSVARERWASLVLVPADRGTSAGTIATSLAEVGTRLAETPVTAIITESLDYGAARTLTELQPKLQGEFAWSAPAESKTKVVASIPEPIPVTAKPGPDTRLVATPMARVIIAIQPVVEEPLGVAIAQEADAVIVCIEIGKSRVAATRKTMQLIGADRVLGAFLLR